MRPASSIAVVLACFATSGHATSTTPVEGSATTEADSFSAKYERQQRQRYDLLRSDGSPRMQVLAGRIYLDGDDPANKLLPKREDVVARAVQLAPDDALVQWFAADQGNYASNACGPARRPETEVANLVRLEPDNAAAWQYALALASVKGDAARVDEALSHMAAATRARDHQGEVAASWTKLYTDHPELLTSAAFDDDTDEDDSLRPSAATLAFVEGLQQSERYAGSVDGALEAACKPDAGNDTAWQRLGWCVRAGELLATQGNSFTLRETGLKMLGAAGASPDDLADLRRNVQWLSENAATPSRNSSLYGEHDTILADWKGASDEIAATQNRLKRLGKPLTPPTGWVARADTESAEEKATASAWADYLDTVIADLRASTDARERALGLSARVPREEADATDDAAKTDATTKSDGADTALADLAAANPGNAFVQWIAATRSEGNDEAIAALQRLQANNAATWTLGLKSADDSTQALHHAAQATHFDDGSSERIKLFYAAFARHPMPADQQALWLQHAGIAQSGDATKAGAFANAMMLAMSSMPVAPMAKAWQTCREVDATKNAATTADCVKIARLMLHSRDSLIAATFGGGMLRTLGALDGADREYARQLAWWQNSAVGIEKDFGGYVDDYLATGSEIEALRRMMTRAGKAEPPTDWQPPQWKKEASKTHAATK